ncbi:MULTISPECIES: DsbA family protein [unclassified Rhodococcus (in: high G+C Gram-positive bacteria)]|mgnify:CR=1 FL=1|uniref:DsbA family protein n=1 Tax=unclassified Rhodococcus (in: high G+C Gram-positive bacteria) TaxID=192944 RepID=UPI00146CC7DE|nr:DsbA family protein [Rhodococcus sp. (in: high G+C Gram-positive bacteria)]MBF0660587.1 DsbA family protein [Rhodococcus sp. (in: high G+C Gram-positive bacteria)]NMD94357.1 DsbA family protein [Rhodococcus sp. BL-253-APC-6A1W]
MNAKKVKPVKYTPEPTSNKFTYILGGVAVVVIAALVIGGVLWTSGGSDARNDGYGTVQNAAVEVSLDDGAILLGRPDAAATIDLYEDPMCPYCAELEHKHSQELAQAIDNGEVAVRYHILAFLDRLSSSGDYSTRSVAAAQCVAESGDAVVFSKFHDTLLSPDTQPAEGGDSDLDNAALAQLARDAGASDETVQCIADGARVEQAAADAEAGRQKLATTGATGTPAVIYNGTVIDALGNENWIAELSG